MSGMEVVVVAAVVGGGVGKATEILCGSISSTIKNIFKGPQQLDVLAKIEAVQHIPGPSIQVQTASVSEDLAKTWALLFDNRVHRIGIWGMGGVGKTHLVRNLNNELLEMKNHMPFTCVLWVPVSKNLDIQRVQMIIASRLKLELKESSGADEMATQIYQSLKKERFLLFLDNAWQKINLDILGVPTPEVQSGSKIILTSRSLDVCRSMLTDVDVKMSVLRDEDAWQLFSRYATDVVSSEHIRPLAEAVCRECDGLPLAIITVGAAMRGKTNPEVWKDALNQLRRSVPVAEGVEEEVYRPLKLSYDSLEGTDLKTCFLYCSLFPEEIKKWDLVWYWLAEGLIDEREDYGFLCSRGIRLIENLKDACLLEEGSSKGTVKMHDVVRDVSIWIASTCSEDGSKSLVRTGKGLKEISATELSNSLKRVSFMDNDLERLPDDSVIPCSNASTLLLQNNHRLDFIPEIFLERFKALRVLNFSGTCIESLPDSLLQLVDLRALLLSQCEFLKELPPLERLSELRVIDLSWTGIRELPKGLEQLSNLRHLNLAGTSELKVVQAGVISKLSRLEVLDMSNGGYIWKEKGAVQEDEAYFEELQCLERLQVLSIKLKWNPCYTPQDTITSWINGLKAFEIIVRGSTSSGTVGDLCQLLDAQKRVIMDSIDLSGGQVGWLLSNASCLFLIKCTGLNEMRQNLVINSISRSFIYIKELEIWDPDGSFQYGGRATCDDLLPNLEELHLFEMGGIESISELANLLGLRFQKLKTITVLGGEKMKYLLSLGNFNIRTMPKLEVINVSYCDKLEELFNHLPMQTNMVDPDPIAPKLRKLTLNSLPKLRNLCRDEKTWPGNKVKVDVSDCDLLSTEQ